MAVSFVNNIMTITNVLDSSGSRPLGFELLDISFNYTYFTDLSSNPLLWHTPGLNKRSKTYQSSRNISQQGTVIPW